MKIKAKTKDYQLIVKVKLSFESTINEQELDFFSRKLFRGFLKPKITKRNVIDFTGPVGISLYDRLRKPISKYDFFFIIEQIVDATQKLQKNNFMWNKVIWDIKYSYINEATKEVQFLFLPLADIKQATGDVRSFIESVIYSAQPVGEHDTDFVSRFSYFLQSMSGFDPGKVEEFIKKEDRSVVNTIKKHRANSSGFMTDKRQDYYKHYDNDDGDDPTGLLDEGDDPTGLINEGDEPTGLLRDDDEATGLLNDGDEDATGLLNESDEDATGLLVEGHVHYPSLFRVLTEETILINKPVFRIGKERSYVDYFVTNNNAVSRSHADIVTRGSRYFVIDLNSKNRTYINGKMLPVQYETEIFDGDRLKLGNEEFIFNA